MPDDLKESLILGAVAAIALAFCVFTIGAMGCLR